MKLYEFSVTDEFNLQTSEIIHIAERAAADKAVIAEWGDFKVVERKAPEQLATGETRYFFDVVGEYASSRSDDSSDFLTNVSQKSTQGVAAAPPPN